VAAAARLELGPESRPPTNAYQSATNRSYISRDCHTRRRPRVSDLADGADGQSAGLVAASCLCVLDAQRAVVVGRPLFTRPTTDLAGLHALVLDRIERLAELRADVVEALLRRGIEVDARVLAASLDPELLMVTDLVGSE